jgi:hypothetical protein
MGFEETVKNQNFLFCYPVRLGDDGKNFDDRLKNKIGHLSEFQLLKKSPLEKT